MEVTHTKQDSNINIITLSKQKYESKIAELNSKFS